MSRIAEIQLEYFRNEGFSDAVIGAINAVTKRFGESYDDFVQRAALNPIGRSVKLADLENNSNLSCIANPTEKDFRRLAQRAIESIRSMDEVLIQNKEMRIEPSA